MFEIGAEYRRRDLHAQYGGQTQQGISTPANSNLIFLITGKSGAAYGYDDGWEPEGVYRYFGMGTTGNMRMEGANERVRDAAEDGSELHLFEDLDNGFLRYMDEMTLAGWKHQDNVPDVNGQPRRAIVFYLSSVNAESVSAPPPTVRAPEASGLWAVPMPELRKRAQPNQARVEEPKQAARRVRERSRALRIYVLRRANGVCEACEEAAPFKTPDGRPFLEAHHTRRLSDGGLDDPRWVIAICPNCHRRAHYAEDAETFNNGLKTRLRGLEAG
ncbi:5-methylcytosine-specific restriction protein A [Solirubrobacter pauli]|uniref:5-methylcytosine-specific restriction protein A n=1 Tax=Solirubrobacter pauli TaxID=166793 RepID=A0A660L871_9ACTN|nr:HNH endonuclease signature motif containing protein [Solirubrobacter pauli]RKQ90455.1 5-methylcytosine-specific restriction protein A [Solirubrobacter pauli]